MEERILIKGNIKKDKEVHPGYIISNLNTGLIEEIKLNEAFQDDFPGKVYDYPNEYIIEAGDFNAHSHPEQSIYTDIVDKSWDLGTWCRNTIYRYSVKLQPEHIYYGCLRAFSRMLTLGVTSVMVSFYCHGNKGNTLDKEVLRAAKDTGIRLYFGRMNYDILTENAYEAKKDSQKSYFETPDEAEMNFYMLFGEMCDKDIIAAPSLHSIHASTKEAIVKGINLAFENGKYIQFHLSEDKGDVDLSLELYGMRPLKFLESLLKNKEVKSLEHVILSDCIWLDDEEYEVIKKYNMNVVLNPRMNERVKAGKANLEKFLEMNIPLYLGTDGEASNDDLSIIGERNFLKDKFTNINSEVINSIGKTPFKFNQGYIGTLDNGHFCDIKVTNKEGLVSDVFVSSKNVVKDGNLLTMNMDNDIETPLKNLLSKLFVD